MERKLTGKVKNVRQYMSIYIAQRVFFRSGAGKLNWGEGLPDPVIDITR